MVVDNKEQQAVAHIKVRLTPQQRQVLVSRAQSVGMNLSEYLRDFIPNSKRTAEEIITREWVSIALQLRKLQSDDRKNSKELQQILKQLEQLIQNTTLRQD